MAMFPIVPAPHGDSGETHPNPLAAMFGPQHVDHVIRQAIGFCWMALPKSRQTPDEVERQIRRLVDRALEDFREDQSAFTE
jgi:hypothetical protein